MLVIRQAQMEVFSRAESERFVQQMVAHIRYFYFMEAAEYDAAALAEEIRSLNAKARTYGIVLRPDVCRFLNLAFEFDHGFDKLPWAAEILNDPWQKKIDRLCEAGLRLMSQAGAHAGKQNG